MGYLKLVQREDEKQAAMSGLMTKQLTQPSIEKHLKEFGRVSDLHRPLHIKLYKMVCK